MTKPLCKNCKYLETDGMFGIFCGVGGDNTKYNCPKYAEKGVRMAKKRFTETLSTGIVTDNQTGKEYNCEMRIDDDFLNLVNIIAEENEQLQKRVMILQDKLKGLMK